MEFYAHIYIYIYMITNNLNWRVSFVIAYILIQDAIRKEMNSSLTQFIGKLSDKGYDAGMYSRNISNFVNTCDTPMILKNQFTRFFAQ